MSFLSELRTIGSDIEIGIAAAAPIVGTFVPATTPILAAVETLINGLERIGAPQTTVSAVTQAVATVNTVQQHIAAQMAAKSPAPAAS